MSPKTAPTVSVIIPNYNHARYLRKRIDSVLGQTYQDFEVILLDDCSTDNSREILASYSGDRRVTVEFNMENSGGVFKQWNKGVLMARGRYIWIAESDDYADTRFLARMVPILEEQPEVTFAYCRSWRVGEDDQPLGFADSDFDRIDANHWTTDFTVDGLEECRRYFVLCDPVSNTSAVVFRKEIYERIGRANDGFRMCGDYRVWAAMALEGKITYTAEPLNYYRSHRENVRTRTEADALGVAEYFHVMLWILERVVPADTLTHKDEMKKMFDRLPLELKPFERVQASRRSLSYIADWNLRHNRHVPGKSMRAYFTDWEFALVGQGFAISPPGRWKFFLHRCRFFRDYFLRTGWKQRLLNLARALGAPLVGYQNRRWPEEAYAQLIRMLDAP
jgi:glycosyltransferase involved in cell wall biosynthesis